MFLQCDDNHLACLLAIDGLFLLNLFYTYNDQPEPLEVGPKKRSMAQDIMMVENQIPFIVLKEIHEALYSTSCSSSHSSNYRLTCSIFQTFCKIHSPLKLCSNSEGPSRADHLLHYMYFKIVNNVRRVVKSQEQPHEPQPRPQPHSKPQKAEEIKPQTRILEATYKLLESIPKNEIVEAYEQTISILETFCQSDQPVTPSASTLHDKGGFRFHGMEEDCGIKNIRISGTDVYLPVITLNKDSDVILRNLIAYEALTSKSTSFPLIEFMVLMCALVVNVDDVKRLKNVIEGDLEAEEVVKLFTGMSSCLPATKMEEKSKMKGVIDEINKVYNSGLRMRAYLLLKKFAQWLLMVLRAIGGFVGSSWKIVAFILSLVTVVLLTLQAYCDVYGCGNKKARSH
ncbi:putative UPF0481 protein At3g02645 [Bidens hawaiensis]|uniref:putative UPF0481 protein At3g02645 n=1 Tax=Bidens hawaiensis TaxID=980011 RepID=UPI00404BA1BC